MKRLSQLSRSIAGNVALITGAASGMGKATARLFADEGARLAIVDIDEAGLHSLTEELKANDVDVLPIAADCASQTAVEATVHEAADHFGALDILVNNAGLVLPSALDYQGYDDSWQASMNVMANAQQWAIRAALPYLQESENPRVVNIASTEGLGATPHNSAYVAAKHASIGLTRAMAVDLGKQGITVNCICPGPIHTAITAGISDDDKATFTRRRTALRRYGSPEEVAHMTLSLVLPSASFITGTVIPVDGGLTIRNA
ncbi:MAG: SDR family oxidoreductase [Pseudomonadota bacterium]